MPLETGSTISALVSTNPVHTDGLNAMDAHLRLLKAVLKATFPNFTASLSATEAALDAAVTAVATNGVAKLADAGAFFKTNTTDGFTNPSAGTVGIETGGVVHTTFTSAGLSTQAVAASGAVSAGSFTGPGVVPIGGSIVWWSDTLPDASWAWCNGGTYPRSNAALFAVLGTNFGVGDGSTTANLPDLRDAVPVGKGTMGATTAIGRITNFTTSVLGNFFGTCLHLLTTGEMPSHTHTANDSGHTHGVVIDGSIDAKGDTGGSGSSNFVVLLEPAGTLAGNHPLTAASGTANVSNSNTGGGTTHNNVQPSLVCNWIIRLS